MPHRPSLDVFTAACFALSTSLALAQGAGAVDADDQPAALTGPVASLLADGTIGDERWTDDEEAAVVSRLESLESIIEVTAHPITQGYIRGYTLRNRDKTEAILGRIAAYFPLFERELAAAGLPDDLKYLALTESALDPRARSRTGAGGLWQFMPGTAEMYGLRIDGEVDERANPERATQAAVAFLRDEYERFGDWQLVLAAYNGGPGRVRRALRRSGESDYWELRRYLPRETRNYVPAFVAAKYLHLHGAWHGLRPRPLTLDEQLARPVACPEGVSLQEVAQACDLSLDLLRAMNPHVLRDTLSARPTASVRVPTRAAASLTTYLEWRAGRGADDAVALAELVRNRPVRDSGDLAGVGYRYFKLRQALPGGVSLAERAESLGVSEHHLRLWNPLSPGLSPVDREITVFVPRFVPATPFSEMPDLVIPSVATPAPRPLTLRGPVMPRSLDARLPNDRYRLARYESLLDVWQRFSESMTWQEFVAWNAIEVGSAPPPGTELLVRRPE